MMSGQSATQLQQHAQRAFQASDQLLRRSAEGGGSNEKFYQAATRYASTLKSLSGQSSGRGDAAGAGAGTSGGSRSGLGASATGASGTSTSGTVASGTSTPGTGTSGSSLGGSSGAMSAGGGMIGGTDLTSVALINHGVKEALDSMQIKQMVRMMGSSDSPAAQQLLSHAREMDTDSREALQAFGGSGGASGASGTGHASGGGQSGMVQTLAQQANDVIQAIQELGGESARPGQR